MPELRVALAQTNPVVGDISGNARQLLAAAKDAWAQGADLMVTGELALSGYPIEDLALRDDFLVRSVSALEEFARELEAQGLSELVVVVGHPDGPFPPPPDRYAPAHPQQAQNCLSIIQHGRILGRYAKHHLPNYGVFDEFRTFIPGTDNVIIRLGSAECGVMICEDLWRDDGPVATFRDYPVGAVFVVNASPFERDKDEVRLPLVTTRATQWGCPVVYVNLVGGQDDLVFDGDSVVVDSSGALLARSPLFVPHVQVVPLDLAKSSDHPLPGGTTVVEVTPRAHRGTMTTPPSIAPPRDDLEVLWGALVTGVTDYVTKNGFASVILGLSGGIDSAVCATIAADAIGAERVVGVSMPSRYSSGHSKEDAKALARNLGIDFRTEEITDLVAPFDQQLGLHGLAAENVQARVRGLVLMSMSNLEGHLVLTTGNKSELAVGYSTIYGDSVGGFAPIKDVPKTLVWELAKWRNRLADSRGESPPIPTNSIEKPPSAELRPGQTDQDSLPDYATLDAILDLLIVHGLDRPQIVAQGFDDSLVADIVRLVDRAEWKRRQGAIGPRISSVAFGRDRRLPVTSRAEWSREG